MEEYSIGKRIKYRRNEMGLTLRELSELCGILPQLISDYENDRKEPGLKNIRALCKAMNIYPSYLVDERPDAIENGKTNSYGVALNYYLSALKLSKKDDLDIDVEKRTVDIHIKDDYLVNALIQSKDFIQRDDEYGESIRNFNINMLSHIEIKDDENSKK